MTVKAVKIKEVCTQINGVTYGKDDVSDTLKLNYNPILRASNISNDGTNNYDNLVYVRSKLISETKLIKAGDILIAASTGSKKLIGKATQFQNDFDGGFGAFCKVLRPNESIDNQYLGFFFQRPEYRHYISIVVNGANINNIRASHLNDIEIPLPPLEIQKQIAQILATADQLRKDCQQVEQELNALSQSVFLDMFGDPSVNSKQFPIGTIKDLVAEVKYGTSGKADEFIGDFPILRMNNITYSGEWNFSSLKYINLDKKEHEKYLTQKGDILFNRTNSRELVGKTAVFREDTPMAIAGYLIRVRVNNKANSEYISAYLNSIHGKKTLQHMCKSIVGMANINAQELQKIKILMPPKKLQDEFDNKLEKIRGHRQMNTALFAEYNDLL